jgi:hypothetical protein
MKPSLEQLLNQQDNASRKLVQSVEELKQGLERIEGKENKPLNPEALAQIQCAVQIQSETIDAAVANRIIAGLSFSSMHSRYDGIEDAHASTFWWFFDDGSVAEDCDKETSEPAGSNQTDSSDAQTVLDEAKATAEALFNDWLSQPNSDILHISGKLGSGKSTLMKFSSTIRKRGKDPAPGPAKTHSYLPRSSSGRPVSPSRDRSLDLSGRCSTTRFIRIRR